MKIQIDLPEDTNRKLKIYKIVKGKNTLEECAIEIIDRGVDFEFIKNNCKTIGDLKNLSDKILKDEKQETK